MAAVAKIKPIYDILYRDTARLASFYAQLFGGHLQTVEISNATREAGESSYGGSVSVVKGDRKSVSEATEGRKESLSPHDIIATSVLDRLTEQGRIHGDFIGAKNGQIVNAHGVLFLDDGTIMSQVADMAEHGIIPLGNGGSKKAHQATLRGMRTLKIPSVARVRTSSGTEASGTIKDAGLDEPIASFYIKHGADGLPDVHLIGIKEASVSRPDQQELSPISTMVRTFSTAMAKLIVTDGATRVTPFLIYRVVGHVGP